LCADAAGSGMALVVQGKRSTGGVQHLQCDQIGHTMANTLNKNNAAVLLSTPSIAASPATASRCLLQHNQVCSLYLLFTRT
jgi:hypothetical protein